ncbi:MAG TPA: MotA/TolQ/ExbB proton channel family protein [Kiritimatiellia bacterium]|nr:MotA/TolQ/ExbB proton channel family protein [Kiritimatiellia bacterium]HSA19480.1 MotA/TolQ/ExbB proton channel family protein [Kiritimatiellia bacterium]
MSKRTLRGLTILMLLQAVAMTVVWAQEPAAPAPAPAAAPDVAAAPAPAAKKMTLWNLIVVGGWAMWPLGACSLAMVGLAVLNFRQINRKRMLPEAIIAQLRVAAKEQNLETMVNLAASTSTLFTNGLMAGLRKFNTEDPMGCKPNVESAIAEAVGREESQASFWINFLSLVTAMSPMWGLIGTVSGMIGAFQKIGSGGMGKPELLAANIGEALITTAAGLIIAIPSMFFYFLFRNLLNRIIQQAELTYSLLLDDLTGSTFIVEEAPPA